MRRKLSGRSDTSVTQRKSSRGVGLLCVADGNMAPNNAETDEATAETDEATDVEKEVEDAMSRLHLTEPTQEDALLYLSKVQHTFSDHPDIYNEFRDILRKFKAGEIDTDDVINRVLDLFRGHDNLILGFNTFLPVGYRIEIRSNEEVNDEEVNVTLQDDVGDGSNGAKPTTRLNEMGESICKQI